MSRATVVLLRHGRTAYNAAGRLQGQIDIPLDEVGRWQAATGCASLLEAHTPTHVLSSDLIRAVDTAQVLADAVGLQVVTDARLQERSFGQWEGLTAEDMAAGWPQDYAAWKRGGEPTTIGAESRREVGERFAACINEHAESLGPDAVLVAVAHGAAISIGITTLLGIDPEGWKGIQGMHNVHWSVLRPSGAGATPDWRLTAHNVGPEVPQVYWAAGPDWILEPSSA